MPTHDVVGRPTVRHSEVVTEERLEGGIANAGAVVRVGDHVLRPSRPSTPSVHAFLLAVRAAGFLGVPEPIGFEADGRQRLRYIDGDVPMAPYPRWSQSDRALTSMARLLRQLHDAARAFDPSGHQWNDALADPTGGPVVGHNDAELSNVVFRDGVAVAFIDFEFAAPGRPIYDLAQLARLCVPIEHEVDRRRMGWTAPDPGARLRLVADAYGLDGPGRHALLEAMGDAIDRIEAAARDHFGTDAARAAEILASTGGLAKYDRRRRWWQRHLAEFEAALR